jgi:hypothetical protein
MTASVQADVKAVVLTYEVTVPPATTVTIIRVGPSGTPATVRSYSIAPAAAGIQTARDFEAPIGVPITYTLTSHDSAGELVDTLTTTITVPGEDCDMWVNDLARINNTMRVIVESLPELEFPVPTSTHEIITRRDPIITSDVAHTPAFELSFLTETLDQRDRAKSLLGNGVPVLLRTPPVDGVGNLYFSVLAYKEQRIVAAGAVSDRRFVVSGRQVQRPDPNLYAPIGVSSYQHVRDTFADYQELLDDRASYDAVLYDWSGVQAGDIVPWPPTDV